MKKEESIAVVVMLFFFCVVIGTGRFVKHSKSSHLEGTEVGNRIGMMYKINHEVVKQ